MQQPTQQQSPLPKGLYYEMLATSGNETTVHSTCYTLSPVSFALALATAFCNSKVKEINININNYQTGHMVTIQFDIQGQRCLTETTKLSQEDYEAYRLQLPSLLN
jgi:ribonuclease I